MGRLRRQGPRELRGRQAGRQGGHRPGPADRGRRWRRTDVLGPGREHRPVQPDRGRPGLPGALLRYRPGRRRAALPRAADRQPDRHDAPGHGPRGPQPGPGLGGHGTASLLERANADVILALALVHHLAIGRNVPLPMVMDLFADLAPQAIIEWVPRGDPMVDILLASREDVFTDYTSEGFEAAARAAIRDPLPDPHRGQHARALSPGAPLALARRWRRSLLGRSAAAHRCPDTCLGGPMPASPGQCGRQDSRPTPDPFPTAGVHPRSRPCGRRESAESQPRCRADRR